MQNIPKLLLLVFGFISLGLGILGIFLPLLPTTPFLLLSAFLFSKSSDKFHNWLLNHRTLGPYIRSFQEDKSLSVRVKVVSVSVMWLTMFITGYFFVKIFWVRILLAVIGVGVSIHILSFKTKKKN
jgi:uncharacterized membrane protein YbaN (DUF454 family)